MFAQAIARAEQPWWTHGLLALGGDERIAIGSGADRNRYGCPSLPNGATAAFGSATCSIVSDGAYAHLEALTARWRDAGATPAAIYRSGARRLRSEIARLCGLQAADRVVLASSGTDIHLIAADLARGRATHALTCVLPDPAETGRGVPAALAGAAFGTTTPHGGAATPGAGLAGVTPSALVAVPLRGPGGEARPPADIDRDFEAACLKAARAGSKVLLALVDVSKTGLVAPSLDCAIALKARLGETLEVLVDACQFRLSPAGVAAYLEQGFVVAVTGSKFVAGPPFSGALLVPAAACERLRARPPAFGLRDYSLREDWPEDWAASRLLPSGANLGLLLRWEAALHDLRAFRALPVDHVAGFLRAFAAAVEHGLDSQADIERVTAPRPRNRPGAGWDAVPTIFPFLLLDRGGPASPGRTEAVYRALRDPRSGPELHLGQPVSLGSRDGRPLSALRLCASARLVVEALGCDGGEVAVIRRARDAITRTADTLRRTAEPS